MRLDGVLGLISLASALLALTAGASADDKAAEDKDAAKEIAAAAPANDIYLATLERYFHYRNLDVSTLKELARRWMPDVAARFDKESPHVALEDIRESIRELRYYRENLFRAPD